jgi:hypothetical protein
MRALTKRRLFMPFSYVLLDNQAEDGAAMEVAQMGLRRLRAAIQNQEISFPSQVPVFPCQSRSEIQWRLVELYFIRNWSCTNLGQRYGVTMERVRQLISQWVQRAAMLGYLQQIPGADRVDTGPERRDGMDLAIEASIAAAGLKVSSLAMAVSDQR